MQVSRNTTGILLGGVVLFGIIFSLLFGVINGTIFKTQFSDYADDAEAYNHSALNMVGRGTFANEDGTYYAFVRRSIGYQLFLAGVYSVWRSPVAAFVAHEVLFAFSIVLVWLIARRVLPGYWAFLPTLLFAIAWFIGAFVIRIGSDLFGMTLGLLFLCAFLYVLDMRERRRLFPAILAALPLGAMALVRPVMLYFIPVAFLFLLSLRWRTALVFAAVAAAVVTPALYWNYSTFGTFQLASSGYMLSWRTAELAAPRERIIASTVAAFLGDAAGEYFLPGYAADPDPYIYVKDVFERRVALKQSGMPDDEIEALFYKEGVGRIRAHPVLFLASGIVNAVRLHTPPNINGVSMFHFFAENERFSLFTRIALNILVRVVWLGFLAVALWGALLYTRQRKNSIPVLLFLLLFIGYTIGTHALFTNAEFRYLLPIVPFYIIFASYAIYHAFHRYSSL